jgi:hypothetical protein
VAGITKMSRVPAVPHAEGAAKPAPSTNKDKENKSDSIGFVLPR